MESFLGFSEPLAADNFSSGYKLVPWISWDDWSFVKDGLFSSSPDSIASALRRISAWRSRGCIPIVVDVTASIIEIQQKDPFFRDDISQNLLHSEEMLAMLYCMAIMRLVNGVVEKTRKRTEASIGEAADVLGIPRMLIDVRHECSHRDLPSVRLVRLASVKALEWLKSYYWEPQAMTIPSDQTVNIRKEVKSILRELFLLLNVKPTQQSDCSIDKEKRVKYSNTLFGRNKILSLKARKISSDPAGSKKHFGKKLKSFFRLYTSFSSEVVSVLLRFLLRALESVDLVGRAKNPQSSHTGSSLQTTLDDWKPVITKLSKKEPVLLLTLLKEILDMIETLDCENYDFGAEHLKSAEQVSEIEKLSYLFEWLVLNCRGFKLLLDKGSAVDPSSSEELDLSSTTLFEYLHRCLKLSCTGNHQLMHSALVIASMTGNSTLVDKLNKLASVHNSNQQDKEEISPSIDYESFFSQQEDSLRQAAAKLEVFKHQNVNGIDVETPDRHVESKCRWVVAKSWNSCSIGMLPPALGCSGHLPVLDLDDHHEEVRSSSEIKELPELNFCDGKREADCAVENLDISCHKKMKVSEAGLESNDKDDESSEGYLGHLLVGGVLKKVREEEMLAIASAIRIELAKSKCLQ